MQRVGAQTGVRTDSERPQSLAAKLADTIQADPPRQTAQRPRQTADKETLSERTNSLDRISLEMPNLLVQREKRSLFRIGDAPKEDRFLLMKASLNGDRREVGMGFKQMRPRELQVRASQLRAGGRDQGQRLGKYRTPTRTGLRER